MKKTLLLLLVVLVLPMLIFATSYPSLYTLDFPYMYQSLSVTGGLGGGEAFNITIDTSPAVTFAADAGLRGNYEYVNHQENSHLFLSSANSNLSLGSTGIVINPIANGYYRNYAFSLGSMPAYYRISGGIDMLLNIPFGGGPFFRIELSPVVGAGIGRMYNIQPIKTIINTMNHFGITPSEEMVKEVAQIMYSFVERMKTYSNDDSLLEASYYRDLAKAYSIEDKALELSRVATSQVFAFESARWAGLMYGWNAYANVMPSITFQTGTTSSFTFDFGLELGGQWATLLADDTIYLSVRGNIIPAIETSPAFQFNLDMGGNVNARYFFDNPRMWVDSNLTLRVNLLPTFAINLNLDGQFNYLIAPNFTTYAGVNILRTFDEFSIVAGGEIRVF
ncbi:MAG: hypothetical protein EOM67_10730 [Spirochaetia bacterium]|nr:hypothetical protein [Spirochaetia bacterium]